MRTRSRKILVAGLLMMGLLAGAVPAEPAQAYTIGVGHFSPPTGVWATGVGFPSTWVTPAIRASNAWTNVSSCDFCWVRDQVVGNLKGNVVFAYNWGNTGQIALTGYKYDGTTIHDVKIRLNTYYPFAVDGRSTAYDVQNTLTHEFGHALPLGHSSYSAATMYRYTYKGETAKRSLHFDDINGIRAIY